MLILTRETRANDWNGPRPFLCLSPASYVEHEGERPIAITWRVRHPLSADVFRRASLIA